MAGRTGLQVFSRTAHKLCAILVKWRPSIAAAINSSSLSAEDKTAAITYLTAAENACNAFNLLMTKFEN